MCTFPNHSMNSAESSTGALYPIGESFIGSVQQNGHNGGSVGAGTKKSKVSQINFIPKGRSSIK